MWVLLIGLEAVAMLAVLPVGLGLLPQAPGWIRRGWGWLAPPAALALLLPRGGLATALSVPWPC